MSKVSISIQYAGIELRVHKNEAGQDVVPLKPISDSLGLNWKTQHEKITNSAYLKKRLGICIPLKGDGSNQKIDQTCILLSRVVAFLNGINPERVRANGNIAGADYLEEKQVEWDDALHDYELIGVAVNTNIAAVRSKNIRDFLAISKHKLAVANSADRQVLDSMMRSMAQEIGHPYQSELTKNEG